MVSPSRLAEKVNDLRDDLTDNLDTEVSDGMDDTAERVKQNIASNDSIASGELWLNAQSDPTVTGSPDTIVARRIEVPEVYKFVEYGTGLKGGQTTWPDDESFPSPDGVSPSMLLDLQMWIEQKGISGQHYSAEPNDLGVSPLANAIAESIVESGTKPHPFMRPAWYGSSKGRQHVIKSAERAINKSLRRM